MIRRRNRLCGDGVNTADAMRQNWFRSLLCVWTAGAVLASGCRAPTPAKVAKPLVSQPARAPSDVTKPSGRAQVAIDARADAGGKLTATVTAATTVNTAAD